MFRVVEVDVLIASTAPVTLRLPCELHSRKSIREVVVDGPGRLVGAHVCLASSALASALCVEVCEGVVVLVAGGDGFVDGGFSCPGAGAFAAVPVACCFACGLGGHGGEAGGQGQEGELLDGYHGGRAVL